MRNANLLVAVSLLGVVTVAHAQSTGPAGNARQAIVANYQASDQGVDQIDANAMLADRAPEYVVTDPKGKTTTLPQFSHWLNQMAKTVYQARANTDLVSFNQNGDTAEATVNKTYVINFSIVPGTGVAMPPGHPETLRDTSVDDWQYENGSWMMVSSHITSSTSSGGVASLSDQEKYQIAQQMQQSTNMMTNQIQSMGNTMQMNQAQMNFTQDLGATSNLLYGP